MDFYPPEPQKLDLACICDSFQSRLGSGFFNDVWELTNNKDYVVKVAKPYFGYNQPLSWLIRQANEHSIAAKYFRVPQSFFVRSRTSSGKPVNLVIQKKVNGTPLSRLGDRELTIIRDELLGLVEAIKMCLAETNSLPDVIGGPPRWCMHDIRCSNNLVVDEQRKIWLIDPAAMFLWFSRSNIFGRYYTNLLVRSAERLARRAGIPKL